MATYYSNTSIIYRIRADVTESNVNQSSNTSTVSVALYLNANGSNAYSVNKPAGNDFYIDINGSRVAAKRAGFSIVGGQTIHIMSASSTITHNADGSKTVAIGFGMNKVGDLGAYDPSSISGSANFALTKINRLSTATLDKARYNPGDTVNVTISKSVSSYTTTIVTNWYQADTRRELVSKFTGTSYSFTLPEWLYSAIPSETSGWGSLSIQTLNGDTLLGASDTPRFDIDVPNTAEYQPEIGNPTITEADPSISTSFGAFIQGKTKLRIQSSATGKLYSTISRIEVTVEGVTYIGSDITTNVINGSGNIPITIKAIDSRGYSSTKTVTASIVPYSAPALTLSAFRCNSSGVQDDNGRRVRINTTVNYSGVIVDGDDKNTFTTLLQYSSNNGSTWTNLTTLTASGGYTTAELFELGNTYLIRATVTDSAGSSITKTLGIGQAFRLMSFGKSGRSVAFGKSSADTGKFEVEMQSVFNGAMSFNTDAVKSLVNVLHPIGEVLWLQAGKDPNTIFPGTTWKQYRSVWRNMVNTGFALDAANGQNGVANDTNVLLYQFQGRDNQRWSHALSPASNNNTGGDRSAVITEQVSTIPWLRIA